MKCDFLLNSATAKTLYQQVKDLPIIDYHNHLSLDDLKNNKRFLDIFDLWIKPDPYKHRAMRMCGIPEKYITGDADGKEKFLKWCEILPSLLGNPLYHWSLMELNTVFGIDLIPSNENALYIYEKCNEFLKNNEVTANSLLDKFNVELTCPCASLTDDISFFKGNERIAPSLRGDDIVSANQNFMSKLSAITNISINSSDDFETALKLRLDEFEKCGLVFTDHALDNGFDFKSDSAPDSKDGILKFLATEYSKRGLVMQLHIGAKRHTSSRLREAAGAAGGFAAIGNSVNIAALTLFLDTIDKTDYRLPKTLLFTLNPADNALISVLAGSYSKDGVEGLITQGPAWWWCDHKQGITEVLDNISSYSLLSNFVGMTTDSRSFLSYVRHDYFRRIVCNWVAEKIDSGEFIASDEQISTLLLRLCYQNAKTATSKETR